MLIVLLCTIFSVNAIQNNVISLASDANEVNPFEIADFPLDIRLEIPDEHIVLPVLSTSDQTAMARQCPKCTFVFTTIKDQQNHYKIHGSSSCFMCGDKSWTKPHFKDIHPEVYEQLYTNVCTLCNERFKQNYELRDHKRIQHEIVIKKSNFYEHKQTIKCPVCSKECFGLKGHIQKSHKRYYEQAYRSVCISCFNRYRDEDELQKHRKKCLKVKALLSKTKVNLKEWRSIS